MTSTLSELALLLKAEKAKIQSKKLEDETQIKESFESALAQLSTTAIKPIAAEANSLEIVTEKRVVYPKSIPVEIPPSTSTPVVNDVQKYIKPAPPVDFESRFKKLQEEFSFLKRAVVSASHSGGGEVRLLKLDDVNTNNLDQDAILAFDTQTRSLNFYQPHDKVFSNVISKPTTINKDMSYTVLSYLKVHNTLHVKGNLGIL